jgi:ligand-binding SRPBCC domain-containing protein
MIHFSNHSGIHTLLVTQKLPIDLETAWEFFSNPANLARITPEHMGFRITSAPGPDKMFAGQIITYTVSPFQGISSNWVTEISHIEEKRYFIDEQRFGPYSMWHHEHWFESIAGGIKTIDRVSYKLPLGFIGRLVEKWVVRNQLRKIFSFRHRKLVAFFGAYIETESEEDQ